MKRRGEVRGESSGPHIFDEQHTWHFITVHTTQHTTHGVSL